MAKNLPYCGKGLWKLPDEIINNKSVRDNVRENIEVFDKMGTTIHDKRMCMVKA